MTGLDWVVLGTTLLTIVAVGLWRTRRNTTVETFLRGDRDARWWTIGLSIMATQASAITFLSTPGQGFVDGLGFVQFYFGLPIAMVILSVTLVPLYHRLKVYTAYEYLEGRFDLRTRRLTAFLFLLQRGLGAGLAIYAPAIVLSAVLGWPLETTILAIGAVVVAYTVSGGARIVQQTQTTQMVVMLSGMAVAFVFALRALPHDVTLHEAVRVAGTLGRLTAVDPSVHLSTRYTLWSGLLGGLFVALAYFGTDQSQVQRYLTGGSLTESRLGLLFNGLVKVPMQFLILLVGVAVFVFYQFHRPPVFFHQSAWQAALASPAHDRLAQRDADFGRAFDARRAALDRFTAAPDDTAAVASLRARQADVESARKAAYDTLKEVRPKTESTDADYVFLTFVTEQLPAGLVGLLLAVILCASMSACASALSALGSTTVVDFYRRSVKPGQSDAHYLLAARLFTVGWGVLGIGFATFASRLDNLIQAVNVLGSLFYGPTLGVFLVGAATSKAKIDGRAAFWSLVVAQAVVFAVARTSIGFLWYNVIGCAAVVVVAPVIAASGKTSVEISPRA